VGASTQGASLAGCQCNHDGIVSGEEKQDQQGVDP
jgi:hypothetical protein